jgi:kinetochore protein Nuf2
MSSFLPSDYSTTPLKKAMGGVETISNTQFIFPVLKNGEILQCMAELGIDLSKAELSEPQRHKEKVRKVFWQLLEVCRGTTEEDLQRQLPTSMGQLGCVPPAEQELHEDNMVEMLFFQEMRQCMKTCGILDFSWKDLHYATAKRFRCQLSATINMAKFREEQLKIYSELNEPRHQLLLTLEELHAENAQLQEQLDQVHAESTAKMEEYDRVAKECQELESEIARSNKLQASKREEASQLKKQNNATKDELAAATWNLQETQAEEEGLLGKLVSSPDRRRRELESKKETLEKEKAETRRLQQEISEGKAKSVRLQGAIRDLEATMALQQQVLEEASRFEEAKRQVDETTKEIDANKVKTSELSEIGREVVALAKTSEDENGGPSRSVGHCQGSIADCGKGTT